MLNTIVMNFLVIDSVPIAENSIVDKIGDNNKVIKVKIGVEMTRCESQNLVESFLTKFQSFTKSFKLGFLIPKTRLVFNKLR